MPKILLLLVLLVFTLHSAAAQNPVTDESLASQQFKQQLRGKFPQNDTAQAIITLYACLLAAFLFSLPLAAQTTAPPPLGAAAADSGAVLVFNNWYLPRYQPGAHAGADTTGALLSLFRKRRYAGYLYTIPFIVGVSLALPLSSTDQYGRQHVASEAIAQQKAREQVGAAR